MGLVKASTGPDLMAGDYENVMADYDGLIRLAPAKNLLPDPDLSDVEVGSGDHRYWKLGFPLSPTHWVPFVRDKDNVTQFARQVTAPLPLNQTVFNLKDELIQGASPLDKAMAYPIAPPSIPDVDAYIVSTTMGFPEGYYTVAYGYILDNWQTSTRLTGPGPRSEPVELGQGQGMELAPFTSEVENTSGIAIYVSEPRATPEAAKVAPLRLQMRLSNARAAETVRLIGPYNMRGVGDVNDSFVGKNSEMPKLRTWIRPDFGPHTYTTIKIGYVFVTEQGESAFSDEQGWYRLSPGRKAMHYIPESFPPGVLGWIPYIRFYIDPKSTVSKDADGNVTQEDLKGLTNWYTIQAKGAKWGFFSKDTPAKVWASRPANWENASDTSLAEATFDRGRVTQDTTGVEQPTDPVTTPIVLDLNTSGLSPGMHYIKTALLVGEEEGPSSPFITANLPNQGNGTTQYGLKIHRPLFHNQMDNADGGERYHDDVSIPEGWDVLPDETQPMFGELTPEFLAGTPMPEELNIGKLIAKYPKKVIAGINITNLVNNIIKIFDNSWPFGQGAGDTVTYFRTGLAAVDLDRNRFTVQFKLDIDTLVAGSMKVYLEEYKANGSKQDNDLIETFGKVGVYHRGIFITRTDDKNPNTFKIQNDTTHIRLRVVGYNNPKRPGREFTGKFWDFAVFNGFVNVSKPPVQPPVVKPPVKPPKPPVPPIVPPQPEIETTFPHGGYCRVVLDPEDGPYYKDYTPYLEETFDANNLNNWTTVYNTYDTVATSTAAAQNGAYGLRIARTANSAAANGRAAVEFNVNPTDDLAIATELFLDSYNLARALEIGGITDANGSEIAALYISTDGKLMLRSAPLADAVVFNDIDVKERVNFQLKVSDVGTNQSTVSVMFGQLGGYMKPVYSRTVDTTGRLAARVHLGHKTANLPVDHRFNLLYDNATVSNNGIDNIRLIGGNYIEYYGPEDTPLAQNYGPYGMRVPVKGSTNYTISAHVWRRGLTAGSYMLRARSMSKDHRELEVHAPVVTNIDGTLERWVRHSRTIETHPDAAYVEFFANRLGGGVVRLHGIQMEEGTTATAYSRMMARSGSFSVFLSTRPEGMLDGDPLEALGLIKTIRDINVAITDDDDVSSIVRYRSGNDFAEIDAAAYTTDWSQINKHHSIIEVRVELSSSVDFKTPEVRDIEIHLQRHHSILCREDGTEFKGGVLATEIRQPSSPPRFENIELASGATVEAGWGNQRTTKIACKLTAFRPSTVKEIQSNNRFIIELPDKRYRVRSEGPLEFTPEPNTRLYINGQDEYFQKETADFVGYVLEEDVL